MKYALPVSFNVVLEVEIDGTSIQDAYSNFQRDIGRRNAAASQAILDSLLKKDDTISDLMPSLLHSIPLDTLELDEEEAESLNPKNVYSVEITRTISITVEVQAHSEEDANEIAFECLDNGDYEEEFEDSMCAVTDNEIGSINLERQVERKTNLC